MPAALEQQVGLAGRAGDLLAHGLVATTLNFDYEVRSAEAAFRDIPQRKIEGEMLELARHIIQTKMGEFDPSNFDDRYEAALEELVKAKIEGRKIKPKAAPKAAKVVDLMEALRASAKMGGAGKSSAKSRATSKRKAG